MSGKNAEQYLKSTLFNAEVRRLANDNPGMPVDKAVQEADKFATEKTPELYRAIEKSIGKIVAEDNKGPE